MSEKMIGFWVYLYLATILCTCSVLLWALYRAYNHSKRYFSLALCISASALCMALVTISAGDNPFMPIDITRRYIIASRAIMGVVFTYLALQLLAKYWLTFRGEIPWPLRFIVRFKDEDVQG